MMRKSAYLLNIICLVKKCNDLSLLDLIQKLLLKSIAIEGSKDAE